MIQECKWNQREDEGKILISFSFLGTWDILRSGSGQVTKDFSMWDKLVSIHIMSRTKIWDRQNLSPLSDFSLVRGFKVQVILVKNRFILELF